MENDKYKEMSLEEAKEILESIKKTKEEKKYYWDLTPEELIELQTAYDRNPKDDSTTIIKNSEDSDEDFLIEIMERESKKHI